MQITYERIKRLRIARGMSQEELAKRVGYTSRAAISKIEKGATDLGRDKLIAFASALGTTPMYLFGATDDVEPTSEAKSRLSNIMALYATLNEDGAKALEDYALLLSQNGRYTK